MINCPYCNEPFYANYHTERTVAGTKILLLYCGSCSKLLGVVNKT